MLRNAVLLTALVFAGAPALAAAGQDDRTRKIVDIVAQNYPAASLARGEQGSVAFEVGIDRRGRLESCAITQSSGYPDLDSATCEMLLRHARFSSRRGAPLTTVAGSVDWKHPLGDAAPSAPPPMNISRAELAESRLICKRDDKNGSLVIKTKYCLTRSDWTKAEDNARRETLRLTNFAGSTF
jgi:TonB family protein